MECSTCFEPFDAQRHRPKSLACGHTICIQCLQNPDFGRDCPFDRKPLPIRVADLPDNYQLVAAIQELQQQHRRCSFWCLSCRAGSAESCVTENHVLCWLRSRRAEQVADILDTLCLGSVKDDQPGVPASTSGLHVAVDFTDESQCPENSRKGIATFFANTNWSKVTTLKIVSCSDFESVVETVLQKTSPHLEDLDLQRATTRHLKQVQKMPSLRKLKLMRGVGKELPAAVDPGLKNVRFPVQLQEVYLESPFVQLLFSQPQPNLRRLNLCGVWGHSPEVSRRFRLQPNHLSCLRYLRMDCMVPGSWLHPVSLKILKGAPVLEVLSIQIDVGAPTDVAIGDLAFLRRLELRRRTPHDVLLLERPRCLWQQQRFRHAVGGGAGDGPSRAAALKISCDRCDPLSAEMQIALDILAWLVTRLPTGPELVGTVGRTAGWLPRSLRDDSKHFIGSFLCLLFLFIMVQEIVYAFFWQVCLIVALYLYCHVRRNVAMLY